MDFGMPFLLECPSIESACALCAKLGLQFVELNLSFPLCNLDALTAQRLNSLCAQYGLYFTFHLDEELAPCAFDSRVRAAARLIGYAIDLALHPGMTVGDVDTMIG